MSPSLADRSSRFWEAAELAPLERYLVACRQRGYSETTIYGRRRIIARYVSVTGSDPLEATEDTMIGWWSGLRLASSSRRQALQAIRGYCRWAMRHRLIESDPTILIDAPRLPQRLPRPIDEDLLGVAMSAALPDVRVILCLAAFCGLRACEISRMTWADIRQDKTLIVNGKGNKERIVPMPPVVFDALNGLPSMRRKGPVIGRRDGVPGPLKPHMVSHRANHHLHDLGIPETLHQLRHRFGTLVYQSSGCDIRLTQNLMGHASPDTTAGYAAFDQTKARPVIDALPVPERLVTAS